MLVASAGNTASGLFVGVFGIILLVVGIALIIGVYWAPTITAYIMQKKYGHEDIQLGMIAVLNFFAFFLLIGWVAAWVFCFHKPTTQKVVLVNGQPGYQPSGYTQYPQTVRPEPHEAGQWPSEPVEHDTGPAND
jgi:hypothetical protein